MKSTLITAPVSSFRRIESPYEVNGSKTYLAVLNIKDVPKEIKDWRKINVRDAKLTSGVAKKIATTLKDEPENFFFKNRGLTLLAESVSYDSKTNKLKMELSNPEMHGLLDGGHSFMVIQEHNENNSDELDERPAFVRIEILEGIKEKEQVVGIVESRNTSTQVRQESLDNLRGIYEGIKTILKKETYADHIAYKEFELLEDGSRKNIDIKDILSYLMCFDREAFNDSNQPINAYKSKSAVVDHFQKHHTRMEKYLPLLPDILSLYDTIYENLPDAYDHHGGRFKNLTGIHERERAGVELPFINKLSKLSIPSGFIYPILAAFRNLVEVKNGKCSWKESPIKFYNQVKLELARRVGEQAKTFRDPNRLGKDLATWNSCYDAVKIEVLTRKI